MIFACSSARLINLNSPAQPMSGLGLFLPLFWPTLFDIQQFRCNCQQFALYILTGVLLVLLLTACACSRCKEQLRELKVMHLHDACQLWMTSWLSWWSFNLSLPDHCNSMIWAACNFSSFWYFLHSAEFTVPNLEPSQSSAWRLTETHPAWQPLHRLGSCQSSKWPKLQLRDTPPMNVFSQTQNDSICYLRGSTMDDKWWAHVR